METRELTAGGHQQHHVGVVDGAMAVTRDRSTAIRSPITVHIWATSPRDATTEASDGGSRLGRSREEPGNIQRTGQFEPHWKVLK